MKITDVKVGTDYRLNYQYGRRGRVTGLTTKEVKKGYGWNSKTINQKRAVVQPVDEHTGKPTGGLPLQLTGRDIEEEWAAFAERQGTFLAEQRVRDEVQAAIERALERVDVDAKVSTSNTYRKNNNFYINIRVENGNVPHFLEVLERAVQYAEEAGLEDKVEITEYDRLKETLAETRNEDGNG